MKKLIGRVIWYFIGGRISEVISTLNTNLMAIDRRIGVETNERTLDYKFLRSECTLHHNTLLDHEVRIDGLHKLYKMLKTKKGVR